MAVGDTDRQKSLDNGMSRGKPTKMARKSHRSSYLRDTGVGLRADASKASERPEKVPNAFLIEEADFCRRRPRLQVIAYVHSAISRVQERRETRSTWANATASGLGVEIAAVFMVGRAKNQRERQIVQEESQRYHDIVQGDYVDHYRQLSLKALSSLAWVQHHCPQVPWTLHADDDVFIDVFLLKSILEDFRAETTKAFLCNSEWSLAQRAGRWAVSRDEYRNNEYPVFCTGAAWVLPTRLLPRLLRASQTAPFLWVDDVYITGVLAEHAGVTHLGTVYKSKHIQPSDVGDDWAKRDENWISEPSRPKAQVFLIEEADFCRRRPRLQVIAYVHSAISRVQERRETRSTWANATASGLGVEIAAVFMVGRAKNQRERQIVQEESQRYHDIVQGDYDDDYRLLTYKGLTALAWIAKHCGRVPWTLHSDDDTFIDIFTYVQRLEALDEASKERLICNHKVEPVLRTGRWRVNEWEFPDAEYPTYCSGGAWFLRTKLVPRLLDACRTVPFLWVDDVYITGLLAREANVGHFNGGGHCFEALNPADIGKMLVCQLQHKRNTSQEEETEALSSTNVPKTFQIEADFCRRRPRLQVIAYVHSAISRVQERRETRSTWANATASGLGVEIAAVFNVGRAKNQRERQIVQEESQRYHDIVQGDYVDSYRKLSFKALASLSWITQHCPDVPWTLHADDDVFIDVFLMLEYLREENPQGFFCNVMWSQVMRSGKWAVSRQEYPSDKYPAFCSGEAWVLPTALLPRLLEASKSAPFLWVDDVYVTGILAQYAGIAHLGIGSESRHIRPSDVGRVMAWHSLEDDRKKWWTILTRVYKKALQRSKERVSDETPRGKITK
ncbi:hypothetical protein C7M84_011000 [Penaeus vannamei]|uniref:Uncharacterized protein n=1 Tax=Penaeus vannamei TaxID=6689 RepID=A0A3R7M9F8_PENVA|nr:hypothetical protein C7M84_011000 [Penaeus vannamei]